MKILKIWAENVRGIENRVEIEIAPTGLTLIHGRNEIGKTTISEVLHFIFKYPSSTRDASVKALQPKGKDVSVIMGAEIEINEETYWIEKKYVKNPSVEVSMLAPRKQQFNATDSNKIIERIFNEDLDPVLWAMLQVGQGQGVESVRNGFSRPERNTLRKALESAVAVSDSGDDTTFLKKIKDEFEMWFTPTGAPKDAQGSKGKELKESDKQIKDWEKELLDLDVQIAKAAHTKNAMESHQKSEQELGKMRDAQILAVEIKGLEVLKSDRLQVSQGITDLVGENPNLDTFNSALYQEVAAGQRFEFAYESLASLTITALKDFDLSVNGAKQSLPASSEHIQKLESPLVIQFGDLAKLDYSNSSGKVGIEASYKKYVEDLAKLGFETFGEAEAANELFKTYQALVKKFEELTASKSLEDIQSSLAQALVKKSGFGDEYPDLVAGPPISEQQVRDASRQVGRQEGEWEQISKFGWHEKSANFGNKISDERRNLEILRGQSSAIKLLKEVVEKHKSAAEADYSVHFSEAINALAKEFFGDEVEIQISEAFEIEGRYLDGATLPIEQLSTGAQEQVSVLLRLALSRIVQAGQSVPIFFDDELGHTDPQRIKAMSEVFNKFGNEQQFILLTCYPEKFKDFVSVKDIDFEKERIA